MKPAEPDDSSYLPFLLHGVHGSICPGRVICVAAPAGAGSVGLHLGRGPQRQPAAALPAGTHLHLNNRG